MNLNQLAVIGFIGRNAETKQLPIRVLDRTGNPSQHLFPNWQQKMRSLLGGLMGAAGSILLAHSSSLVPVSLRG
jgi:hypothetical protein